ncbi:hypothetical protein K461DRAFT_311649 [Myriangium duriaei CBS 260.36]|uniref:Apple domain-containing protein n=1 Tax=Myriangium duriaei CBS 260.36 TaxID=1168546 RepID=A0A9P4JAE2_9PEZI|nr:hypothetical protein K461DRAFT_311649 [Myriangium duriaei CBS 260.36]
MTRFIMARILALVLVVVGLIEQVQGGVVERAPIATGSTCMVDPTVLALQNAIKDATYFCPFYLRAGTLEKTSPFPSMTAVTVQNACTCVKSYGKTQAFHTTVSSVSCSTKDSTIEYLRTNVADAKAFCNWLGTGPVVSTVMPFQNITLVQTISACQCIKINPALASVLTTTTTTRRTTTTTHRSTTTTVATTTTTTRRPTTSTTTTTASTTKSLTTMTPVKSLSTTTARTTLSTTTTLTNKITMTTKPTTPIMISKPLPPTTTAVPLPTGFVTITALHSSSTTRATTAVLSTRTSSTSTTSRTSSQSSILNTVTTVSNSGVATTGLSPKSSSVSNLENCETGQYLLNDQNLIFDHFSIIQDYGGAQYTEVTDSMVKCMDLCQTNYTDCKGVVWVFQGQAQQYCYIKTSTVASGTFDSKITAYSVIKNTTAVVCDGQGINMLNSVRSNTVLVQGSCESGPYLVASSGGVFDHFSTTMDYGGGEITIESSSVTTCMDTCYGYDPCVAISWIPAADKPCYIKTSLTSNSSFDSNTTAYSAVRNTTATVCNGLGTNMIGIVQGIPPKPCETGQYLVDSHNTTYDQFSMTQDYQGSQVNAIGALTASSMLECLNYCYNFEDSCLAVVWFQAGMDKQYCAIKSSLASNGNFSSSVIAYSAVKNKSVRVCAGQGTNMTATSMQPIPCETGQYLLSSSGRIFDQVSNTTDYAPSVQDATSQSNIKSMKDCLDLCQIPDFCVAVVWNESDQICYLKETSVFNQSTASPSITAYSAVKNTIVQTCAGKGTNMVNSTVSPYCPTGGYTSSSSNLIFDQVSTTIGYALSGTSTNQSTMTACLDYCQSLPNCTAATWIQSGYSVPTCFTSNTVSTKPLPSTMAGYSALRHANITSCPGQGTPIPIRQCETQQYLLSTNGTVFDSYSAEIKYDSNYPPQNASTLAACLDWCVETGTQLCVAATWDSVNRLCYYAYQTASAKPAYASDGSGYQVGLYSGVRRDWFRACPGVGTNMGVK